MQQSVLSWAGTIVSLSFYAVLVAIFVWMVAGIIKDIFKS